MRPKPPKKHLYLITSGDSNSLTTPETPDFVALLNLVRAAVDAGIDFVQLREKQLSARVLFELTRAAAEIVRGSSTRLLVNDRADIAAAAGADGVHLAVNSLPINVVRSTFGADFIIGASTHSLDQATRACTEGADFVVMGPIFATSSKAAYGPPLGTGKLREATSALHPFPVLALGGVTASNVSECIRAGAKGVAAIRLFSDPATFAEVVQQIRANSCDGDEA